MRKGLLSSVATVLVGASSALAQNPYYLPTDGARPNGVPALLSAEPATPAEQAVAPKMSGGSTGLVPGVDCLPQAVGNRVKIYGDASYMLAFVKNAPNPSPLAIVSPGFPIFGPGTQIVAGGGDTTFDGLSGVRGTFGGFFGDGTWGLEGAGFILQSQSQGVLVASNGGPGSPVISRPFANANLIPPGPEALLVAEPGVPGGIAERETIKLWGAEGNAVMNWRNDCHRRTDLLAGFTYTDLHETLGVTSTTATPTTSLIVADSIGTRNQFYAGQVGGRTTYDFGRLSIEMSGKIAMGVNHETVDRSGVTTGSVAGIGPFNFPTGLLVQQSNGGRLTTDRFCVGLPSQILLGYHVSDSLTAFIGWDFIYLTTVARPGDQVDLTIQNNPTTGASIRPIRNVQQTDFWANSLLLGMSFKY
jgi:hypothetical protein